MVVPFFETDKLVLYHGDCRDVLSGLSRYDSVITDPPYFVLPKGKPGDGFKWDGFRSFDDFVAFTKSWLELVESNNDLKSILSFWSIKYLNDGFSIFNPSRLVFWRHPNLINVGSMNDFAYDYEPIFVKWMESPILKKDGRHMSFFDFVKPQSNFKEDKLVHPTQKPLKLMRELVSMQDGISCVLDPFAGSGTTGIACLHEGIRCILIERELKYCEIIRGRVEKYLSEPCLF